MSDSLSGKLRDVEILGGITKKVSDISLTFPIESQNNFVMHNSKIKKVMASLSLLQFGCYDCYVFHRMHDSAGRIERFKEDDVHADSDPPIIIVETVPDDSPRRCGRFVVGKSSKPSLSGENGLGESVRCAADGIDSVKILLRCPGVAPPGAIDELQFLWSLPARAGLTRSRDFPVVEVFSAGLCHDGEYRTLSI